MRSLSRGSASSATRIVCALGVLFALCACKSDAPTRRLISIAPSTMPRDAPVEVTITGQGFLPVPSVALMSSRGARLHEQYRVELPPSDFHVEVTTQLPDELLFTPPRDLEPGPYDVRVVPPLGAALVLPNALMILPASTTSDGGADASTAAPGPRRLSLETRADGEGEVIGTRTLRLGETLRLHAVVREPDGSLSDVPSDVSFRLSRQLATLTEPEAQTCEVLAQLPGTVTLIAELGDLRAEAVLTLIHDSQSALADLRLSIEDAPGGAGSALGSGRKEAAGTLLTVYAVVRDRRDAFVVDVPVTWQVGDEAAEGTNYGLRLLRAGETVLRASHEELGSAALTFEVSPGPAFRLSIEPQSASLRAGDPPLTFTTSAVDEYGNDTTDLGEITYSVSDGNLSDFDVLSATLAPTLISQGRVTAKSSHGPEATTGTIEVTAGPLARMTISPTTLQLTADSLPVQFEVTGVDAFDNQADVGDVTWSVSSGAIATLSADGLLDPTVVGAGSVRATGTGGVSAQSGPITITGGKAVTLSVAPDTWRGVLGGATQAFEVTGFDGDGNETSDVGTVSYGVTGPIRAINTGTGLFTPTVAGQGTVTASSSYGPSVATRDILVSNPNATLSILDLRVSGTLYNGATTRMEVDVRSNDVVDVVLTGLGFTFTGASSQDISSQYTVVADNANVDRITPNVTQTLVYHLTVAANAAYAGTVDTTVRGEAFMSAGTVVTPSRTVSSNVSYPDFGTSLTIDAPVPPADRACIGGRIAFGATADSSFSYSWRFAEGTVAPGYSTSDRYPRVDYNTVGPKANAVTASYTLLLLFTYPTTLVGKPVFVGTASNVLADTYPTGRVVFAAPTADQNVALSSFPRANLIALDPAVPVRQCNNIAVDASGHNDLTIFSDRRLIDPAADIDPSAPGIQVELTTQGGLPALPLVAPTSPLEGPTTVYGEYFEPTSGKVTAAGDQTFNLTGDTVAPSVSFSSPASDCAAVCQKTRDPLTFQFSEPMFFSSLTNVRVDLYSAASACTGTPTDWTASTMRAYDSAEHALYVVTPSRAGTYAVRVRIPATVTDAATARNPLPAFSRCVVFGALSDPAAATTPQLTATPPNVFSPDGDQRAESITWNVSADAATTLLRMRISRGGRAVFGKLLPVAQAGSYSFTWDGSDSSGRIVNNGAYSVAIEALNRAGTASAPLKTYVEVNSAVRFVTVRRRQ